jgi:hypothetical protein
MRAKALIPTPPTVVAIIAVVIAATGGAWAATRLDDNSVRSRHIVNETIRGKDLRDSAVRGDKIRDGSLTGKELLFESVLHEQIGDNAIDGSKVRDDSLGGPDIIESNLGMVPRAEEAANAAQLAGRAASRYVMDQEVIRFRQRLSFGEKVEFISNGPVGLEAQCRENVAASGNDQLRLLGVSRSEGSFQEGNDDHAGPGLGSDFLTPATPEDQREFAVLTTANAAPDEPAAANNIDNGFVVGPNGEWIGLDMEQVMLGVRVGGSDCLVIGVAVVRGP